MNIEILKNDRAALDFRSKTHLSFDAENFWQSSWKELHEQRGSITKALDGILENAEKEKRDLTDNETNAFEFGSAAIDLVNNQFEIREKAGSKEQGINPFLAANPLRGPGITMISENGRLVPERSLARTAKRDYRSMFKIEETRGLDRGGFSNLNELLTCIAAGRADQRLDALEQRAFLAKDGAGGGFAIPEEMGAFLFDSSLETEIVRPRAAVFGMASMTRKIPAWDSSDHSSNLFGGFTGIWMAEEGTQTVQTGKVRAITLQARKLGIYSEASREVLADGMTLEEQIGDALIKSVGFCLDEAFLVGTGVSQPVGAINSDSTIAVNRAAANAIAYADIVNMWARLHPAFATGAVWIASPSIIPQLSNVRDTGNNNLWIQSAAAGIPGTLLGRPLLMSEKVAALGSKGDLMLANFAGYATGLRSEVLLEKSNAPGWLRDVMSFRCILRADGISLFNEPITPRNGGSTLSWCVALDVPA